MCRRLLIKKELRAKARFMRPVINPGLKFGVIDNELIVDFSPEHVLLKTTSKPFIVKNFQVLLSNANTQYLF